MEGTVFTKCKGKEKHDGEDDERDNVIWSKYKGYVTWRRDQKPMEEKSVRDPRVIKNPTHLRCSCVPCNIEFFKSKYVDKFNNTF